MDGKNTSDLTKFLAVFRFSIFVLIFMNYTLFNGFVYSSAIGKRSWAVSVEDPIINPAIPTNKIPKLLIL